MEIASYIIENNCTVRQAAKQYGISKSTVHKDVAERLPAINSELARQAREILELNKSERPYPRWTCHQGEISASA